MSMTMHKSEHPIPVRIAYVGGGSLNWAPKLMADLALDDRLDAEVRLYDVDHAAAERNARIGNGFAGRSAGVPARYWATEGIGEALDGADIVVVSILPGSLAEMAQDIAIPERFGILQSVGDTVGPGGFIRALRAIPPMLDIGRAIAEHAPDAYVCNLTNPMSVLTGALHRAHPGIRSWGECHEVTKVRQVVAWIANSEAGAPRWTHRDVELNVLGINHFTFVDAIALDGRDMMPAYRAFMEAHRDSGWRPVPLDPEDEKGRYFEDHYRVKIDLSHRFGICAAAGDRHLAEFMPGKDYLAVNHDWGFGLTPVDYRRREQAEKRATAAAWDRGEDVPPLERSDEALVDQIAALMGLGRHVSNANMPNRGQVEGLPLGAIVETNVMFSGLGITPLVAGRLPVSLEPVVRAHADRQTALLDAVVEGRYGDLFALFRTDPLVAPLSNGAARAMYSEMIRATSDWLPVELAKEAA